MSTVTHHGHGLYCYTCQEVHEDTDGCDHGLRAKAGVTRVPDEDFAAQPDDMGHHGPHMYHEVDGMEMCMECDRVKIPTEMVPEHLRESRYK